METLFVLIFMAIVLFAFWAHAESKRFIDWYDTVQRLAPFSGFSDDDIEDFETQVWRDYYEAGFTPDGAITKYQTEHNL